MMSEEQDMTTGLQQVCAYAKPKMELCYVRWYGGDGKDRCISNIACCKNDDQVVWEDNEIRVLSEIT